MFRRTVLSTAVTVALGSSVASSAAYSSENSVEKLEKIQVTGSRISRVDVEGATPVTVISREDLERSGQLTVADVLRNTTFNSFGSFSEQSGSSAQSQAFLNMRGLGAERTLILLNGKRMPQSGARGDGAVNINALPAAAVERIEILTDGASAVYGSDAIGGVVNIILKSDFEGVNLTVGGANPKIDGGDERKISITGGQSNDKGSILFALEHDSKDIIYATAYKPAQSVLSKDYNYGYSLYGRNIKGKTADDKTVTRALTGVQCNGDFAKIKDQCRYDYTKIAALTATSERTQFVLNSNYFLSDSVEWTNEFILGFNKSYGRFAPAAGSFPVKGDTPGGKKILEDNGLDPTKYLDPAKNGAIYYRFDNVGNRVNNVKDISGIYTSALTGAFETSFVDEVQWNIAARYSKSYSDEKGTGYVLKNIASKAVETGDGFNSTTGQFTKDATVKLTHDTARDIKVSYSDINGGLQFDKGSVFGSDISWYVGAEASKQDYSDAYDAQSASDNVLGSSGNNSGGERSQKALFVESLIPLNEMLELNLAARYDKYSDFGSALSPKASIRFQPVDNLVVRTSYAKGFRAPGLTELYKSDSRSADRAVDYVQCKKYGISEDKCVNSKYAAQYDATRTANKDLEAEKSESFNLGVVFSPIDDLNLGLDYYNIDVKNMVSSTSLQQLIRGEQRGADVSGLITRDDNGDITAAIVKPINTGQLSTSGIDLKADFTQYLGLGQIRYSINGSYVIDYKEPESYLGPIVDLAGGSGSPEYKVNADVAWTSVDSMHKVAIGPRHVAGYTYNKGNPGAKEIASYTTWELDYRLSLPWDGVAQIGVRNMFDRQAPLPTRNTSDMGDVANYSISGRTIYASYSQNF